MKTTISETPHHDAGKYISSLLLAHKEEPTLLVLSGGSALSVVDAIEDGVLHTKMTICMSDERFTFDDAGSNFFALQQTAFYTKAVASGCSFINPRPEAHESRSVYTQRVETLLDTYLNDNPQCYALGVFGIGEDGHTASIFPAPLAEFTSLYHSEAYFVSLTHEQSKYPFRGTITQTFIEEVLDDVILYAVGKNKCENILDYMYTRKLSPHELPALIPASHPQSALFTDCPTLIP